ncbi:hypothetical protein [Kitasatospora sp. SolWspMP-SS2h]|uniref:hypothetical protein n=1 Tax=Kitasatospora sp. SolWspMP-SS2h TaxID=1305729 RepID=UPI0011B93B5A|nr:hypothetical protein [Kitasatospora sp. SolWspMP-SS2h]
MTALSTPWPISCAAAIVLPTAGLSCAQLLQRLDLRGVNTAGSRFFTVLLLFVMAFGCAGVSYPVDNPGHLSWYLTAFIAVADVLVAYGFPRLIIALAHAKSERAAAAA